jgi:hypothetical protein
MIAGIYALWLLARANLGELAPQFLAILNQLGLYFRRILHVAVSGEDFYSIFRLDE